MQVSWGRMGGQGLSAWAVSVHSSLTEEDWVVGFTWAPSLPTLPQFPHFKKDPEELTFRGGCQVPWGELPSLVLRDPGRDVGVGCEGWLLARGPSGWTVLAGQCFQGIAGCSGTLGRILDFESEWDQGVEGGVSPFAKMVTSLPAPPNHETLACMEWASWPFSSHPRPRVPSLFLNSTALPHLPPCPLSTPESPLTAAESSCPDRGEGHSPELPTL